MSNYGGAGDHRVFDNSVCRARWSRAFAFRMRLRNCGPGQSRGRGTGAPARPGVSLLSESQRTRHGSHCRGFLEYDRPPAYLRGYHSIGPGPTIMPSGAATTSVKRILGPLLSGDIFVRHNLDELSQALVAAGMNLRTTTTVIEGIATPVFPAMNPSGMLGWQKYRKWKLIATEAMRMKRASSARGTSSEGRRFHELVWRLGVSRLGAAGAVSQGRYTWPELITKRRS